MNSLDILVLGHLERNEDGSVRLTDTWSTSTLIRTDDGHNIVVDTSNGFMAPAIRTSFKQIGKIFPEDVDIVVLTHCHPDHIGNNAMFKDAVFYVHEGEDCDIPGARIVKEDMEIAKGVRLVFTPGHSDGSMSVFVESDRRYAIAGDAIPLRDNYDLNVIPALHTDAEAAAASMRKISEYADVIIPGHGQPFRTR